MAAVEGQGDGFWSSMGFQKVFDNRISEHIDYSNETNTTPRCSDVQTYLRDNILVFDDTPIYAKLLC